MAEEQAISDEAAGYRHLLDINWTEVADNLIKSRLLLTALELHTELLENGREVPFLRDFFSNPGNFEVESVRAPSSPILFHLGRTSSNLTLDSIDDFTRYSDDGLGEKGDDRIAVLQFELRKAHDTIKSLRGSLTVATEQEGPQNTQKDASETSSLNEETIKPHEKRALNFLVNEYLLQNGYRLTSVTLSDENEDQDFDDWDDVGLNIAQPPNLLRLYRDYDKHAMPMAASTLAKTEEENAKLEETCKKLNEQLEQLRKENERNEQNQRIIEEQMSNLTDEKSNLVTQITTLTDELAQSKQRLLTNNSEQTIIPAPELAEDSSSSSQTTSSIPDNKSNDSGVGLSDSLQNGPRLSDTEGNSVEDERNEEETPQVSISDTDTSAPISKTENDHLCQRKLCPTFKQALLNIAQVQHDSRVSNEVARLAKTEESAVLVLSRCLPHIVPNVLLNKREELLPLILCTAIHHPEEKERDKLLHSLVNLIKRPDAEQRRMIITGCSAFAHVVGHMRTEAELLPQLWEQINHKYPERRQLVAEACGTLAQYLPTEIVSSLLLSMLKQMFAEDRNDSVRATVIKSLALVMTIVESPSKYKEAEQLLVQALCDNSEEVREATLNVLLPAVLAWAHELDKLQSDLLEFILQQLELTLSDFIHIEKSKADDETELESTMTIISSRLLLYVRALTNSVAALMADVLNRAPFQEECDALERETTLS
ncbi:lisH domain and HEAT repeat-containing KIAA1468 homolog isoform X2, partial [Paramuricea clavata]